MNESELKRLLALVDTRYSAPSDFRKELWQELDSTWDSREADASTGESEEPVQLFLEPRAPRQSGWVVTLATAAVVVVLVGLVPFLLTRFSGDSPPPLSTPEFVVAAEDVCLAFAEEAGGVAHLINDSIEGESPSAPWFPPFDPPPSNQLVATDLQVLIEAMQGLIADVEELDQIEASVVDSLRVIRGYYNQAVIFLGRGDGGSALSSVESAMSQWALMGDRGQLDGLPGCYPGP